MALWDAAFGGAAAHTAVGYVDEGTARSTFDGQWQLVGEVNAMRAYRQPAWAACFLKWEDFIQKRRNLPPWRVFTAAASALEMERLKASLPAQWKECGV
jgi:hypothetical protein